jgi:hypothetical protein
MLSMTAKAEQAPQPVGRTRDPALKVGEQALAMNPNDTQLMGEYGYRLALTGIGMEVVRSSSARVSEIQGQPRTTRQHWPSALICAKTIAGRRCG